MFAPGVTLPMSLSSSSSSLLCSNCGSNEKAVRTYGICGTPSLPPCSLSGRSSSGKGEMADTPKRTGGMGVWTWKACFGVEVGVESAGMA